MPTALRYWLFQLPGIAAVAALSAWGSAAGWIETSWAIALFAGWIIKDAAFYPLTRAAYRSAASRLGPRIGQLATVRKELAPRGTVVVDGTLWNARLDGAAVAESGSTVRIVGVRGLLLLVTPQPPDDPADPQ